MNAKYKRYLSLIGLLLAVLTPGGYAKGETLPFVEPDDARTPIIQALSRANRSVDIYIYHISDDPIIGAMRDAVRRGIAVRALLEPCANVESGCEPTSQAVRACNLLTQAGVVVKWAHPAFSKTHAKSALIDDNEALVMTLNLEPESFTETREYGVLTDDAGVVEDLSRAFTQDWAEDNTDCSQPPSARPNDSRTQQYATLVVSPDNGRDEMLRLIRSARSSMKVQMKTIEHEEDVVPALIERIQNGVPVQVLLSQSEDNIEAAQAINDAGGQARFQENLRTHAKMILVDGQKVYLGSHNLTQTSLNDRREIGWVTTDQGPILRFGQTFDSDWAATPEE